MSSLSSLCRPYVVPVVPCRANFGAEYLKNRAEIKKIRIIRVFETQESYTFLVSDLAFIAHQELHFSYQNRILEHFCRPSGLVAEWCEKIWSEVSDQKKIQTLSYFGIGLLGCA